MYGRNQSQCITQSGDDAKLTTQIATSACCLDPQWIVGSIYRATPMKLWNNQMLSNMEEKDTWFNDISYFAPGPSWQSFAAFDFACAAIQLVCTPTQCKTPGKQTCTRNLEIMDGNSMKCWTHWSYWCSNVLANWRKTISTSNFLARDWTEGLDLHPPQLGWWGCVWKWGSHQLIAYLKEQFDDKPLEAGTNTWDDTSTEFITCKARLWTIP